MTGLRQMQTMLPGEFLVPPIAKMTDFRLLEIGEGRVAFEGVPQQMHLNPMGGVQGRLVRNAAGLGDGVLRTQHHAARPRLHH